MALDSLAVPSFNNGGATYSGESGELGDDCVVIKSRKYDISITYHNYYRTPQVWLLGYDENGSILSPACVFQDIMSDYAHRTVTLDPHPHLSTPHASIHPCQHGPAMLRIIKALIEAEKTPSVDQYLFIFLKFIQSVIPTIEYDFTFAVTAH